MLICSFPGNTRTNRTIFVLISGSSLRRQTGFVIATSSSKNVSSSPVVLRIGSVDLLFWSKLLMSLVNSSPVG